ncbi:uncharacterized protein ARMOST_12679 [Armillaria ostoyae]|uniref:RNase H type-1 domain-containing protein n=1 Tax=Armillaria ostoyae TaxID=47428 RepID=A0A284RKL8_ARMOS|nr:uncharacterized protein ARMOST_12679 [Armillaria ostoyae]
MPSEEGIFFNEVLAVVSVLLMTLLLSSKLYRILIYTDNINTVDIFNFLYAKPFYNLLLITAVDALITYKAQLPVLHIPGFQNTITDALSHNNHNFVLAQHSHIRLLKFSPPQLKSRSDNVK